MRPGAQPDLSEARAWVPHAETSYLTTNNPQGRGGAALYLAVSLNGFLTSVGAAPDKLCVCDAAILAQCAPKRHRRTANISTSATAVPHRPLVRSFGRRAIEPVGSLSGLSGAAAGFGGIGDDPGPVVAFANGAFDLSGTNEAPSPVVPAGETADESG